MKHKFHVLLWFFCLLLRFVYAYGRGELIAQPADVTNRLRGCSWLLSTMDLQDLACAPQAEGEAADASKKPGREVRGACLRAVEEAEAEAAAIELDVECIQQR